MSNIGKIMLGIAAVAVIAGFAYYVRMFDQKQSPMPLAPREAEEVAVPGATTPDTPPPQYPIDAASEPVAAPLPPLDASDATVVNALSRWLGSENLLNYFRTDKMIRRFVATVDNLPRAKAPERMIPLKPVPGQFAVSALEPEGLAIDPDNAKRYAGYIDLVQAISVPALVDLYIRLYPLCQQAYRELGYPRGYFNDRLIETLEDLLAAPDVPEPVAVARPKVMYEFANPDLEARSAGQKIMMRMGSANEARVKAVLRKIRKELALRTVAR